MMVHPEDLADVFDDETLQQSEALIEVLIEVRRIYRETRWCLTREEEQDLLEFCRDLDEFIITIFVYDMKRMPPTPN